MTYNHKAKSFSEALDESDEKLDGLFKIAQKMFHEVQHEKHSNRSESVEIIQKTIKGRPEKEIAIIMFFFSDMHNRETYGMVGNVIGGVISESMMRASEYGVPIPMIAPVAHAMGIGDVMESMSQSETKKKEKDNKDKEQKSYDKNYIG